MMPMKPWCLQTCLAVSILSIVLHLLAGGSTTHRIRKLPTARASVVHVPSRIYFLASNNIGPLFAK